MPTHLIDRIPADFPVRPLPVAEVEEREGGFSVVTCGTCGLSWDDDINTSMTPVPSGRCPFEEFHDETLDTRPILELERNNAGRLFIGVTELDERGYGVRSYVLSHQSEGVAESVMERRYEDMKRLMGDNVQTR